MEDGGKDWKVYKGWKQRAGLGNLHEIEQRAGYGTLQGNGLFTEQETEYRNGNRDNNMDWDRHRHQNRAGTKASTMTDTLTAMGS